MLEPSAAPHALAFQPCALTGTLAELLFDEREGKPSQWQASARRVVMAAALDRVLAGEVKPHVDGEQEALHDTV